MPLNYDSLPGQLLALLQAGRAVTVRWDCGGDESWVTTEVDGHKMPADYGNDTDLAFLLDRYLTELLELPSAGEFSMQGTGRILLESAAIVVDYQSDAGYWEYGPDEWLPEEYLSAEELAQLLPEYRKTELPEAPPPTRQPDPQMSAAYTGRKLLFTLP